MRTLILLGEFVLTIALFFALAVALVVTAAMMGA